MPEKKHTVLFSRSFVFPQFAQFPLAILVFPSLVPGYRLSLALMTRRLSLFFLTVLLFLCCFFLGQISKMNLIICLRNDEKFAFYHCLSVTGLFSYFQQTSSPKRKITNFTVSHTLFSFNPRIQLVTLLFPLYFYQ